MGFKDRGGRSSSCPHCLALLVLVCGVGPLAANRRNIPRRQGKDWGGLINPGRACPPSQQYCQMPKKCPVRDQEDGGRAKEPRKKRKGKIKASLQTGREVCVYVCTRANTHTRARGRAPWRLPETPSSIPLSLHTSSSVAPLLYLSLSPAG